MLEPLVSESIDNELAAGTLLAHYRIVSKIGEGGMGTVYLAEDTRLGRKVALKFLTQEYSRDTDLVKRFIQEAKAASALNHPHILTIFEIGKTGDREYIVSEYIEGQTLREHLLPDKPMPLDTALKIGIQIGEAIGAAHRAGIIHRDIKPENIILRKDGYAKLVDFGLAKLTASEADATKNVRTEPGMVMGTAAYMAPEQARGSEVDARADIFSLGVVLYELLSGRQPFKGKTRSHSIVSILEHQPPPLTRSDLPIPDDLQQIVKRALHKRRAERYQTAEELLDDLRAARSRLRFQEELKRTETPASDEHRTRLFREAPVSAETDSTIAVLPFVNMSRETEGDYFSDGLAEELLNVLSKIKGMRVAARTSAFSFKGKQTTVGEIGRVLNVNSVLEGSIRIAGNRVRIAVQLVDVTDGYQLWSDTYDRTMDDIFAVQDDIARSVVAELRSRLLGDRPDPGAEAEVRSEVKHAVKGRAANAEAQRLMLLARHFLDRTTRDDTAKAIEYFRAALEVDPGYALCWAELGRAYSIEAGRAWVPVEEGFERSRAAAQRALELEPDLAEGHAQLGRIMAAYEWNLTGADAEYNRALELAPGSSAVLDGASILAYKLGRFDRAVELSRRVLAQDPLSAAFWHNLGLTCFAADDLSASEDAYRRALELVPQRLVTHALLALTLAYKGEYDGAVREAELEPADMWRVWSLAMVHELRGDRVESDRQLASLLDNEAAGDAFQVAEVYAVRGDVNDAFTWLDRAHDQRDSGLSHAKVDPNLRSLHGDPRWSTLLKAVGFEA